MPTASRIAITEERPPDRLAIIVRDPANGAPIGRWAEDEPMVQNVFSNLTKSGEMPGGHKELSCALSRDPRTSSPDLPTYAAIELQAAGREKVWEGYLQRKPATDGDHMVIEPAATGFQRMLDDNRGQAVGFINCDLSRWEGPPATRRIELDKANAPNQSDPQVITDLTGSPALQLEISGHWESPVIPRCEAVFTTRNGTTISHLLGEFEGSPSANTAFILNASIGNTNGGDVYTSTVGALNIAPAVAERQALLTWTFWTTPAGGDGFQYSVRIFPLIVFGPISEVITLRGTWPHVGYTASQMLGYAIERHTPLEARPEDLEDDDFIIPQAWFDEPGPASNWVKELTKYGLLDWFVLHDRRFEYRFPGTYGRKWQAYAGPSNLKKTGEDGTRLWDQLMVTWQDVDGTTKTAGPPGSLADFTDSRLEITDPDHPAVRARGLYGPKFNRREVLRFNGILTKELAIKAGARALAELNQLDHSGEATLSGYAQTDTGAWLPVSYIQPGDQVRFPDAADRSYRKIIAVSYSRDSRAATVTLDAPGDGFAALQERFNARLESLELGG